MIIGLTGLLGAGKGTVADYFKEKGFGYYSLSDELREILNERRKEETLENLINLGNELRKNKGTGYLAKKVLKKIEKASDEEILVDSIRNPGEIEELKKQGSFFLIAVNADIKIRYQRIRDRHRADDQISFEDFQAAEEKQLSGDEANQQLLKCIEMADFQVTNDKTIEDLYNQVEGAYKEIKDS